MDTLGANIPNVDQQNRSTVDSPPIVLKGSVFTLSVLKLNSCDIAAIDQELSHRLSSALDFFKNAPVVIDLELAQDNDRALDFQALITLIRDRNLVPVGVCNGSDAQNSAAIGCGLGILTSQSVDKVVKSDVAKSNNVGNKDATVPAQEEADVKSNNTVFFAETSKVIHHPIRSGQRVYAKGGDLILLAAINAGAEIMADGNIHIYAPLRGRALAGLDGNTASRIFCRSFEAELVAVAGNYRLFEDDVPENIYKKPVQIYLEGEQLIIEPLSS